MILPIFMLFYVIYGKMAGVRDSLGFTDYLALVGLCILAFTTFWSFYYTRLARRMQDPERRPTWDSVVRILWIGLWASCLGIVVSLVSLFIEVFRLLILFLKAPQGGVPAIRTELESRTQWVSAMDTVSLLTEVCTLTGEFLLLGLTLWLLFRVTRKANYPIESMPLSDIEVPGPEGIESTGAAT
jgi:hypothetical protein